MRRLEKLGYYDMIEISSTRKEEVNMCSAVLIQTGDFSYTTYLLTVSYMLECLT